VAQGTIYLRWVGVSYIFFCITQALISAMNSVEKTRSGMIVSLVSLFVYVRKGAVDFNESVRYGIAAMPGGVIGAYLLDRHNGKIVKRIFAVLLIAAGANMAGLF
jgi:uncharacterized membrane protein YfcA